MKINWNILNEDIDKLKENTNESKEFINYICSINKKLKDSVSIKEITALYNQASS